jgi:hypothetical protein
MVRVIVPFNVCTTVVVTISGRSGSVVPFNNMGAILNRICCILGTASCSGFIAGVCCGCDLFVFGKGGTTLPVDVFFEMDTVEGSTVVSVTDGVVVAVVVVVVVV